MNLLNIYTIFFILFFKNINSYRVLLNDIPNGTYFKPYDRGFVGISGDPANYLRERINEGAQGTADMDIIYEGVSPRQSCPNIVGPFTDGSYYCSAKEYGYCDRRSGTCFCNTGYSGIDCSECSGTHVKIGNLCYPKKLCTNDCSGAGDCDFTTGKCICQIHRSGDYCQTLLCQTFHPLCDRCSKNGCLRCFTGYYLSGTSTICESCLNFDPRCATCTVEEGCTLCADPLLTSIRRSGARNRDSALPLEESSRELSITIPFGSKSSESFNEAEAYQVVPATNGYLKDNAMDCDQGLYNNDTITCVPRVASHKVCGHNGVFKFRYPTYVVSESSKTFRVYVERSGGGYGQVDITYYIRHFTTNNSDLVATAQYTTNQRLSFAPGVISNSFLVMILDDNVVEEDEVFQIVLETPEGGGSVGPQFRANVTILDDDINKLAPKLTKPLVNSLSVKAGLPFSFQVQAKTSQGNMITGGEKFYALLESSLSKWAKPGTPTLSQRNAVRNVLSVIDNGNGIYTFNSSVPVQEQGIHQVRIWHAFPNGLRGQYYSDGFFETLALERFDNQINFNWGTGRLLPRGSDYVSIRWYGAVKPDTTDTYYFAVNADDHSRLWINGDLLVDHWHELDSNLEPSRSISLVANQLYEIIVEYREIRGEAFCKLMWSTATLGASKLQVIPSTKLYGLYEIGNNIVEVQVNSTDTASTKTECSGSGLYEGVALKESNFQICPRDKYGNLRDDDEIIYSSTEIFMAKLLLISDLGQGVGAENITVSIKYNNMSRCFDARYKPERAGVYSLRVYHNPSRDGSTLLSVLGSPFSVTVKPAATYGPFSRITGLPSVLYATAGVCYNFTITARDASRNLRLKGGDDFEVYTYRVDYYSIEVADNTLAQITKYKNTSSPVRFPTFQPTKSPSIAPTYRPTLAPTTYTDVVGNPNYFSKVSPPPETPSEVVRYGVVIDNKNGTYSATVCPVIQGWHEIHVLLKASGISNQEDKIMDKTLSRTQSSGMSTYSGQYVHDSPYPLIVNHGNPHAFTSTAIGPGLLSSVVEVPNFFMVTVRDAYDNVCRTNGTELVKNQAKVTAVLQRSVNATVTVLNYRNGSYYVSYFAQKSGSNLLSVYVNGYHIKNSPFTVMIQDGRNFEVTSIATGPGLIVGEVLSTSYFQVFAYDIDNNRKNDPIAKYYFSVSGNNTVASTELLPCPKPGVPNHPICDPDDKYVGHYYGSYIPLKKGTSIISIKLDIGSSKVDILNSPFTSTVGPGPQSAEMSTVIGGNTPSTSVLWNTVAGVESSISVQLRDKQNNTLDSGGHYMELALYGVAVEWGTILPWGTTPGYPNDYHYRGFFAGFSDYYGTWIDKDDGSYIVKYTAQLAGLYVLRLSVAEPGLNATYFNDTKFGYLVDQNDSPSEFISSRLGISANLGSSRSWTGDLGRRPNDSTASIGSGSYFDRAFTRQEDNIDFDLSATSKNSKGNVRGVLSDHFKFRQNFWSARWVGMITPIYAETYKFTVQIDGQSTTKLKIGGRGNTINDTLPGDLVIDTMVGKYFGTYNFTDTKYREFVMEYTHDQDDAMLSLYWESPSTPLSIVPKSAFTHWRNISHYNTTVHPAPLDPGSSTAYGDALTNAIVGEVMSFTVYSRDQFGNLLQTGNDVPSMVAVGLDGVSFRGNVTDYGNSTYLIKYYVKKSGIYRMYVTMGCCPPHPNVGIPLEIQMIDSLLIQKAPYILTVKPAPIEVTRSIAVGSNLLGGYAGFNLNFAILYHDLHNNPTTVNASDIKVKIIWTDLVTNNIVNQTTANIMIFAENTTINYNFTKAGKYSMQVLIKVRQVTTGWIAGNSGSQIIGDTVIWTPYTNILGSPFSIIVSPNKGYAPLTSSRGVGLTNAYSGKQYSFEVRLYDEYNNPLIVGGSKLYVRLVGANNDPLKRTIIPTCSDQQNGKYLCNYTPAYNGSHNLYVMLLNNSISHAGGLGLTGSYYSSSVVEANSVPAFIRVDDSISFSWADGNVIPLDSSSTIPLKITGQSIRWDGYIVAPLTDTFQFACWLQHMDASVYIDSSLVFDSKYSISTPIALLADSAYRIVVEANIVPAEYSKPVSIELAWSTGTIRLSKVPSFFLFDSAFDVQNSPFHVQIGDNPYSVVLP